MRISDWSSDVCSSDLQPVPSSPRTRSGVHAATQGWMPDQARHDEAAEDEPGPLEFRPPKTTFRLMQGEDEILTVTLQDSAAGLRLDRALAEALPALSRERLKTLIDRTSTRLHSSH